MVFETVRRIGMLPAAVCRKRWRAGKNAEEKEWGRKRTGAGMHVDWKRTKHE
jgi:hypothetical protein